MTQGAVTSKPSRPARAAAVGAAEREERERVDGEAGEAGGGERVQRDDGARRGGGEHQCAAEDP